MTGLTRFSYRIEHRTGEELRVLGTVQLVRPHPTVLDPFLSRLRLEGASGLLVLVSEASGRVMVTRSLEHVPRSTTSWVAHLARVAASNTPPNDRRQLPGEGEESRERG